MSYRYIHIVNTIVLVSIVIWAGCDRERNPTSVPPKPQTRSLSFDGVDAVCVGSYTRDGWVTHLVVQFLGSDGSASSGLNVFLVRAEHSNIVFVPISVEDPELTTMKETEFAAWLGQHGAKGADGTVEFVESVAAFMQSLPDNAIDGKQ